MQIPQTTVPINVKALRLGMFIHLDGGWLSHPFSLSSFKITSEEQLATLRSLGATVLRWSPELSDPELRPPGAEAARSATAPAVDSEQHAALDALRSRREALRAQRQSLAACEQQF
ncbi:MAG: DUF3391 domain-containing protein, partial [Pseudomonadota bacterium]|nr:DUF3391 domain-containing protein [Pseudomonadota bacterium]